MAVRVQGAEHTPHVSGGAAGPPLLVSHVEARTLGRFSEKTSMTSPFTLARAAIGLSDVGTAWTEYGRSDEALIDVLAEGRELAQGECLNTPENIHSRAPGRPPRVLRHGPPGGRVHSLVR